jgi:EmrB/QacA subfamily drug resistance transporter
MQSWNCWQKQVSNSQLKHPNLTLTIITLSYFMLVLDGSVAITALPLIRADLGFSSASLSWIQNSYMLAFGGLLLLGARVGDIFGRRRMFSWGLALFMIASLMVGLSTSAEMMVLARILQGVGAAVLAPSTLALLSASFPNQPARGRALAIYGSITGIGNTVGMVLGGWVAEAFDWRWAFFANVPLGIALIIAARYFIQETPKQSGRVDVWGAVTSTIGMTSIVYGLIHAAEFGWNDAFTFSCLLTGLVCLFIFVEVEKRAAMPLVPLRLFRSAQRTGANLARALFVGSMGAFYFFMSQYLQVAKGLNPLETGLAFLPMTLGSFAIAFFVPKLSRKFGDTPFLSGGLATVTIGIIWLSQFSDGGSYLLQIAIPMLLIGVGQGASTIRLTSAGIAGVSPEDAGAASGLVTTHVQLGSSLGLSILIALAATVATTDSSGKGYSAGQIITHEAHSALLGGGVLCGLALAIVLVFVLPKRHQLEA